eukprot:750859-Prorocentrum_minimum.AAC.2
MMCFHLPGGSAGESQQASGRGGAGGLSATTSASQEATSACRQAEACRLDRVPSPLPLTYRRRIRSLRRGGEEGAVLCPDSLASRHSETKKKRSDYNKICLTGINCGGRGASARVHQKTRACLVTRGDGKLFGRFCSRSRRLGVV